MRLIILDLSFSTGIDLSTVRMLAEAARRLQARGITFRIAEAHYHVRRQLIAEHLEPLLGDLSRLYSVAELVDTLAHRPVHAHDVIHPAENIVASPEFDIVVIGGGSGGLVVAAGGSTLGAKVALVEKHKLGGDCLWYGCVPSKTLIKSAQRRLRNAQRAAVGAARRPIRSRAWRASWSACARSSRGSSLSTVPSASAASAST